MNKINELIKKYCPDGVEIRRLDECCNLLDKKRKPITKASREAGEYPYYGANGVQDYVIDYIFDGTFVLVGEDGSVITKSGTPVVTWAEGKIWVNNHAHIVEEKEGVMLRYLYHYLQTIDITALVHGNIPKLTGGDFRALRIAVPLVEVQREIVRILDFFMLLKDKLISELKIEIVVRKKQYEFYRDKLLNHENNFSFVRLGDIAEVGDGLHSTPQYNKSGNYFFINGNNLKNGIINIDNSTKKCSETEYEKYGKNFSNGTVMMSINGTIGNVSVYNGEPVILGKSIAYFKLNTSEISDRYLYYYLQSTYLQNFFKHNVTGGTIKNLSLKTLRDLKIVKPSIKIQNHIVRVLDEFETICTKLNIELPAEIEARQKQYEYYRDKLLSFKELQK